MLAVRRLRPRNFLNRRQYALPHCEPIHVATIEHIVGSLGGLKPGIVPMLADEHLG